MAAKLLEKKEILLVDAHPMLCEGLSHLITREKDLAVCGQARDAAQAMKQASALKPELVITEMSLGEENGVHLAKSLRKKLPGTRILFFSAQEESLHAERALRAGANGYVMKREDEGTLLSAIRQVLDGKTYLSAELNERMLRKLSGSDKGERPLAEQLSDRELEVFQLLGRGYGTRQIAEGLHMSMKTVETHRQHIKRKLKLKNTFELVQQAIDWIHQGDN